MAGLNPSSNTPLSQNNDHNKYTVPMIMMVSLFFVFGMLTVLNDILFPHFKDTFHLTYTKGMLISQAFFGAYFIMGIPSSKLIAKVGYQKAIVIGLLVVCVGCVLFFPAAKLMSYWMFLGALFTIASGITLLQVVANAYVTVLGPADKASARISLCGGLNSTATIIGPIIGATLILNTAFFYNAENDLQTNNAIEQKTEQVIMLAGDKLGAPVVDQLKQEIALESNIRDVNLGELNEEDLKNHLLAVNVIAQRNEAELALGIVDQLKSTQTSLDGDLLDATSLLSVAVNNVKAQTAKVKADKVYFPYLCFAAFVFLMSLVFLKVKLPVILDSQDKNEGNAFSALSFRHVKLGILAIFLYVGAEVAVGLLLIDFMGLENILNIENDEAAFYVTLYWACAAVARFIGFAVLEKVKPQKALVVVSIAATVLIIIAIFTNGVIALGALIALGFCHSVMWPIIFSVALEGVGKYKTQASGYLIMGVVGGAIIPLLQGVLIDADFGLQNSFIVVAFCYLFLIYYAKIGYKNVNPEISRESGDPLFA